MISIKTYWQAYRKYRNYTVKLRKQSISKYVQKCTGNRGSTEFWKIVKPLISDKCRGNDNITLLEDGEIINKPYNVSNIMNNFLVEP